MANNEYKKANELLNTAMSLGMMNSYTNTSRGILELSQEKPNYAKATNLFKVALTNDENLTPALLGMAQILFHEKKFDEAMKKYQQILKNDPDAPPSIRFGIGICFHRLGNDTKAKQAFERVLKLSPDNIEALVGLAVINLNEAVSQDNAESRANLVKEAMLIFGKAFKIKNGHPLVLSHLASHYFYRQNYNHVEKLATNAFHHTKENSIKAFASYQIAKTKHIQGIYDEAFTLYRDIVNIDPNFILGRYGFAQLLIYQGEIQKAIEHLKFIAKKEMKSFEVHRILGHLYLHTHRKERALLHLKKALEIKSDNVELLVELAQIHNDINISLQLMKEAEELLESKNIEKDFLFLTDYGIIYYKLSNFEQAEKCFLEAIEKENISIENHQKKHVFLLYNLARNYEEWKIEGNLDKAKEIYLSLIKNHPSFIQSYLRLGRIFIAQNDINSAIKWTTLASEIDPKNPLSFIVLGQLYISQQEWSRAQKQFEHILNNLDRNHSFANLALGHIYFTSARDHRLDPSKQSRNLKYGAQFFDSSLRSDESNTYAAVSLGAYMAEQGYIDTAKEIFVNVREATSTIPEIWINLAHIEMCQGNFTNAASIYEKCLRKIYKGNSVPIMEFLTYAYFKDEKFDECLEILKKAQELEPDNLYIQYNIAVVHYSRAIEIISEKVKSLDNALQASEEVLTCRVIFSTLSRCDNAYIADKARQFYDHTTKTLERAKENEDKAREAQDNAERFKQHRMEVLQKTQEKKLAKAQQEKILREQELESMRKHQAYLNELVEKQIANLEYRKESRLKAAEKEEYDSYNNYNNEEEEFIEETNEVVPTEEPQQVKKSKKGEKKSRKSGSKRLSLKKKSKKTKNDEDQDEDIQFEDDVPNESNIKADDEVEFEQEENDTRKRKTPEDGFDENPSPKRVREDYDEEEFAFDNE